MRSLNRLAIATAIAALTLTSCADVHRDETGKVTAVATVDPFQLKAGDCVDDFGSGVIKSMTLVPCEQPHYFEVYLSTSLDSDDKYPGEAKITERAKKECGTAFTTFIGVKAEKSRYHLTFQYPTEQTWSDNNDREILCLVGSDKGGITGSLKGAKQ